MSCRYARVINYIEDFEERPPGYVFHCVGVYKARTPARAMSKAARMYKYQRRRKLKCNKKYVLVEYPMSKDTPITHHFTNARATDVDTVRTQFMLNLIGEPEEETHEEWHVDEREISGSNRREELGVKALKFFNWQDNESEKYSSPLRQPDVHVRWG